MVVIAYDGYAAAKNGCPLNPLEQISSATTPGPSNCTSPAGGNNAQHLPGEANRGSLYVVANSVVVHTSLGLDMSGAAVATTAIRCRVQLTARIGKARSPSRRRADYFAYHAVPMNIRSLVAFRFCLGLEQLLKSTIDCAIDIKARHPYEIGGKVSLVVRPKLG